MTFARVALLLTIGCGDNVIPTLELEPESGSRLQLEWYLFDDGARQLEPAAFYDVRLHARCTAQPWVDGDVRCIPDGDVAVFADAACAEPVGRVTRYAEPTHFIGYEPRDGTFVAARVYRAARGSAPRELRFHYTLHDGRCRGPFFRRDATYHAVDAQLGADELVILHEREQGDGRLAVRVRESDDGMRAPIGFHDRDLAADCTLGPSGTCEPHAAAAEAFADADCRAPAIVAAAPPALARALDDAGCATYHGAGTELAIAYRRDATGCARTTLADGMRAFALGAPVELAPLARTIDDGGAVSPRLQRVLAVAGPLRIAADRLHDLATRSDCRAVPMGDGVRCLPLATVAARTLYARGCTFPIAIAEVPERTCTRPAFARASADGAISIHAIGARHDGALYDADTGCLPYVPPPGTVPHALGPALPLDTFAGGHAIGERG